MYCELPFRVRFFSRLSGFRIHRKNTAKTICILGGLKLAKENLVKRGK